jgi:hypothetical protein
MSKKQSFTFTVWYFKDSGKFYSEGVFNFDATDCGPPGHPTAYMDDAVQHLKGLRWNRLPMPGLIGSWLDGPILVNCDEGHPVLINALTPEDRDYVRSKDRAVPEAPTGPT